MYRIENLQQERVAQIIEEHIEEATRRHRAQIEHVCGLFTKRDLCVTAMEARDQHREDGGTIRSSEKIEVIQRKAEDRYSVSASAENECIERTLHCGTKLLW